MRAHAFALICPTEGAEDDLQEFLQWLHTGSPSADVTGVQSDWGIATGEFGREFEVLWTE